MRPQNKTPLCEAEIVLINFSGRGDKDTEIVAEALAKLSGVSQAQAAAK